MMDIVRSGFFWRPFIGVDTYVALADFPDPNILQIQTTKNAGDILRSWSMQNGRFLYGPPFPNVYTWLQKGFSTRPRNTS